MDPGSEGAAKAHSTECNKSLDLALILPKLWAALALVQETDALQDPKVNLLAQMTPHVGAHLNKQTQNQLRNIGREGIHRNGM